MSTTSTATTSNRVAPGIALLGAVSGALMAAAGCGSAPSCEKVVANAVRLRDLSDVDARLSLARCKREGWSDDLRSCAAGAKTPDELDRCARPRASSNDFDSYMKKSKASEAELQLKRVEKNLKMLYAENAGFPQGQAGPTPEPGSCCSGPNHKCAPDPSLWVGVGVWDDLDFQPTEPHVYSYSYRSETSERVVVEAIGDLDCDGTTSTYTLTCYVVSGTPQCTLDRPPNVD
jgi:hypothetical protein